MLSRERAFPKIQFSFDLKVKFKISINSRSKNHVSLYPLLAAPKQIGKATSAKIKGPSGFSACQPKLEISRCAKQMLMAMIDFFLIVQKAFW